MSDDDGWDHHDWKEAAEEYRDGREPSGGNGHNQYDSEIIQLEIKRLAKLNLVEYERERAPAAARFGMRTSILDRAVDAERGKSGDAGRQGHALTFREPRLWPQPVAGAELLDAMAAAIRRHVMLPEHCADATALWVVHTYLLDALHITPRLAITSPEKGCGKTTLLDVLSHLVWRPLEVSNTTTSPIFRAIEKARPTLLMDEGDTFLPNNEEMRGILNSGHRRGGSALRTVGEDYEPRQFGTYAACAIAMIGKLPGTLADRSITIELQRRLAGESVEPFRFDRTEHLDKLVSQAARWAADKQNHLRAADPVMPPSIFNRVADNWRPLLAIADLAGGEWPVRARRALGSIQATVEDDSARVQLLADIRTIFTERAVECLPSGELVAALVAMEGRPWADWKASKPLSPNALARLLKPLKIRPATKRIGDRTPKGYYLSQFEDAFRRYLDQAGGPQPPQRHKADEEATSADVPTATPAPSVADERCEKPNSEGRCGGVAVENSSFERAANGSGSANHQCDYCGQPDAFNRWQWPGRQEGIWLHLRCEELWFDSEGPVSR